MLIFLVKFGLFLFCLCLFLFCFLLCLVVFFSKAPSYWKKSSLISYPMNQPSKTTQIITPHYTSDSKRLGSPLPSTQFWHLGATLKCRKGHNLWYTDNSIKVRDWCAGSSPYKCSPGQPRHYKTPCRLVWSGHHCTLFEYLISEGERVKHTKVFWIINCKSENHCLTICSFYWVSRCISESLWE